MTHDRRPIESYSAGSLRLRRPARLVNVQLCVSVDDRPDLATSAARRWFEDGFAMLGGELRAEVLTRTPAELDRRTNVLRAVSGDVTASVFTSLAPVADEVGSRPYSQQVWNDMLDTLQAVPEFAYLEITTTDGEGRLDEGFGLAFSCERLDAQGTWLLLSAHVEGQAVAAPEGQAAMLNFLRGVADVCSPCYGEVSWLEAAGRTVLETGLSLDPEQTVPVARSVLRGYSWITIAPEEIGRRLGGLHRLRDSDAFIEVESLSAGGFWLRATRRLQDFDEAAARRVFDVLRPALPAGRPTVRYVVPPNVLVEEDAAGPTTRHA
jgi:hypothetical protein